MIQPTADVQQLGYLASPQETARVGRVAAADHADPVGLQLSPALRYRSPACLDAPRTKRVTRLGTSALHRTERTGRSPVDLHVERRFGRSAPCGSTEAGKYRNEARVCCQQLAVHLFRRATIQQYPKLRRRHVAQRRQHNGEGHVGERVAGGRSTGSAHATHRPPRSARRPARSSSAVAAASAGTGPSI